MSSDSTNTSLDIKPNHEPQGILQNSSIGADNFELPDVQSEGPRFRFTASHFGLMILALMCLVFIAFISIAKSIQIVAVTPNLNNPEELLFQPAELQIDTSIKLPLGNRVLVLPGEHRVSLSAEGYQDVTQTLAISSDRHQQFELVMLRQPGNLKVTLPDGVSAIAIIDGAQKDAKTVPDLITGLSAGKHDIQIDADLYRPYSTSLVLQGKGQTRELDVTLDPAWAEYAFESQPSGAKILVDGVEKGQTPATIKIEEGSRRLSLNALGFKPYERELSVVAKDNITVPSIDLIPADGVLEVTSKPDGAAVILDGEYKGVAPITLATTPSKPQTLRVYKAGYKLYENTVNLAPDEKVSEEVALAADLITVKLSVRPSDAAVYVDGVRRGTGSQTLSLTSLPHAIRVTKPGYVTQQNDIVPTRTSEQLLSFRLLTEEQHYWAQIPEEYTNRLGHEMKLFKNLGEVKMGSSRREDGRRANETVYQAELTKPFYVALHETTNKQFRKFQSTHNAGNYKGKSLDANKAPALNISWQKAAQYCNWLSKQEGLDPFYQTKSGFVSGMNPSANGYRLLSEAEWAWLARNTDQGLLTYAWGNSKVVPNKKIENFADLTAEGLITFILNGYQDGYKGPSPVGRFPPNHRGIFDLAGNAAEWVNDWYSAKGSSELVKSGTVQDPLGPERGEFHVVRGASWARGHLPQLRLAYRDYGAKGSHDIGFRVARYAGLNSSKSSEVVKN